MNCANCGNQIEDGTSNCSDCGSPVMAEGTKLCPEADMEQPGTEAVNAEKTENDFAGVNFFYDRRSDEPLDRNEFYHHPDIKPLSRPLKVCGIVIYFLAFYNFGFYLFFGLYAQSLILLIVLMGIGLGIHLKQSRGWAVALLVLGIGNITINLVYAGRASGLLYLILGAYALGSTLSFHKAWNQYQKTGIVPTEEELRKHTQ